MRMLHTPQTTPRTSCGVVVSITAWRSRFLPHAGPRLAQAGADCRRARGTPSRRPRRAPRGCGRRPPRQRWYPLMAESKPPLRHQGRPPGTACHMATGRLQVAQSATTLCPLSVHQPQVLAVRVASRAGPHREGFARGMRHERTFGVRKRHTVKTSRPPMTHHAPRPLAQVSQPSLRARRPTPPVSAWSRGYAGTSGTATRRVTVGRASDKLWSDRRTPWQRTPPLPTR
jgi:hypothetical protein